MYKATTARAPEPNPYRFTHQKSGFTASAFDTEINREIDGLLQVIETTRGLEFLDTLPIEHALSKEGSLRLFCTTSYPTTGSLLGVYQWVADLGSARFNFDSNLDMDSISLLDTYD